MSTMPLPKTGWTCRPRPDDLVDAGRGDLLGALAREHLARLGKDLAGRGVGDGLGQRKAGDTAAQASFLLNL